MEDPLVVSSAWLADRLEGVAVVDVRDAWEYDGIGHVPGAVNVPYDRFRAPPEAGDERAATDEQATSDERETVDDEEGDDEVGADEDRPGGPDGGFSRLPGVEAFEALFADAGIEPDDPVVFYDDTHGVFAARALVTAWLYGHDRVHLLDGDFSAWNRDHETTTAAPAVESTDYVAVARDPDETPLIDRAGVERALETDALLLDTRDDREFEERHLPGAVNLDWRSLVDDESRGLKSRAQLRTILEDHGARPDREIVLYCNTARRISHTYVVLRHLGYDDVAFYEGSLTEWAAAGGPTETGA